MAEYAVVAGIVISTISALAAFLTLLRSLREWKAVRLQAAKLEQEVAKLRAEAEARSRQVVQPTAEDIRRYVVDPLVIEIKRSQTDRAERLERAVSHFEDVSGMVEAGFRRIVEFVESRGAQGRLECKPTLVELERKLSDFRAEMNQYLDRIEKKISDRKRWFGL